VDFAIKNVDRHLGFPFSPWLDCWGFSIEMSPER
jgi:hypothetical protein